MRLMRTAIVGTTLAGGAALLLAGTATGTPGTHSAASVAQGGSAALRPVAAPEREPKAYRVTGPDAAAMRLAVLTSGLSIQGPVTDHAVVDATPAEVKKLRDRGLTVVRTKDSADRANERVEKVLRERARKGIKTKGNDFPAGDEAYHTYDETVAAIDAAVKKYPDLVKKQSAGKSHEKRDLWMARVGKGGDKAPEVMITCNIHAREHLTTEQCLDLVNELTTKYTSDPKVKKLLDNRVVWIMPITNPDGSVHDISGGKYHSWRKSREQHEDTTIGTDLNRNWGYKWGCCGGSSPESYSATYRGEKAFDTVETKAISEFIKSRSVNGKQRIKAYLDIHTYGELVMWPYGYTQKPTGDDMTPDQNAMLKALGEKMASSNKYHPEQSSALYVTDGDTGDWNWGDQHIPSIVMELYPHNEKDGGFYPPASVKDREVARNRQALMDFLDLADCQYRLTGKESEYCKDTPAPGPTPAPTPSPTGSAAG